MTKAMTALKLRVVMYDAARDEDWPWGLPEGAAVLDLDPRLEARIVQEEVWSQTAWPAGERPIADLAEPLLLLIDWDETVCRPPGDADGRPLAGQTLVSFPAGTEREAVRTAVESASGEGYAADSLTEALLASFPGAARVTSRP